MIKKEQIKINKKADFRGLKCPLPVLKTRRLINEIMQGDTLEIIADDPAAILDFKHFCEVSGNILELSKKSENDLIFIIRKS